MKPVCTSCRVTTSTLWRKGVQGEILCNSCGLKQSSNGGKDAGQNGSSAANSKNGNGNGGGCHTSNNQAGGPVLRKSSRIKPAKNKVQAATKTLATKGKSRRIIFKKSVRLSSLYYQCMFCRLFWGPVYVLPINFMFYLFALYRFIF